MSKPETIDELLRDMTNAPWKPKVLPANGPGFPFPVSSMCLAKNPQGGEIVYAASGRTIYRLEKLNGEDVFVPLRVIHAPEE